MMIILMIEIKSDNIYDNEICSKNMLPEDIKGNLFALYKNTIGR